MAFLKNKQTNKTHPSMVQKGNRMMCAIRMPLETLCDIAVL